ncbi:hypothetical protein LIER_16158 [Lithospermum erythrorhizon]|uniref:Uncharacterized protein n=1 Tax=Lithospermum erythrorhizon TaxID=34254 RepID=A0AAV3Q5J3_LITER
MLKEKVMDLAREGSIMLEEEKVSDNHVTITIIKPAEVKVSEDISKRKLDSGMLWGVYSSDSDHEDMEEACYVYMEI